MFTARLELESGKALLRLAHLYEVGEDKDYSVMASVELKKLFPDRKEGNRDEYVGQSTKRRDGEEEACLESESEVSLGSGENGLWVMGYGFMFLSLQRMHMLSKSLKEFVSEDAVVQSVKLVAESLARHIYGQQGKKMEIFTDNTSLKEM
ncbi:unnamed protein product [Lactuca virosa]|uniref:Uncharacterized protein n=1 Tax=Lactuca virosa TaxID=75947 RepID=A0AAU9LVL8_9ASTR|nr:unnamed protein product [Lactuca virosa]